MPLKFLRMLPAISVIVAYDNDQPGNLMAQRLMEQLPNSVRRVPKAIDWNQELQNMFNLELKQRSQRQVESNNSKGFSL